MLTHGYCFLFFLVLALLFLAVGLVTLKRIVFFKKRDIFRVFMWAFLVFFIGAALSGIFLKHEKQTPIKERMEIVFALDVSLSSLARDVIVETDEGKKKVSRLEFSKRQIINAVDLLRKDSVGVIAFADIAVPLQFVVSEDAHSSIMSELKRVDEDFCRYAVKQGTDYGNLFLSALEMFNSKTDKNKMLLIFTDGESQGDKGRLKENMDRALEAMSLRNDIAVFFLGVGNERAPSMIPQLVDENDEPVEYYKKDDSSHVLTAPNAKMLAELSDAFRGYYLHLSSENDLKNFLESSVEGARRQIGISTRTETVDLTQFFIICVLVLLFLIPIIKSV